MKKISLDDVVDEMKTKEDFLKFLELLKKDYLENQDSWENPTMECYLDTMAVWTEGMLERYYVNIGEKLPDNIPWRVFAEILLASKIYE